VVEPNAPYKYEVEQLDGTLRTVKVINHHYRFVTRLAKAKARLTANTFAARAETKAQVHQLRFDMPVAQILNKHEIQTLKSGRPVSVSLETQSALAMEYSIGEQTRDRTGFQPSTSFLWELRLHTERGQLKAIIEKITASRP
jgi:hypothetical protein